MHADRAAVSPWAQGALILGLVMLVIAGLLVFIAIVKLDSEDELECAQLCARATGSLPWEGSDSSKLKCNEKACLNSVSHISAVLCVPSS